MSDIFTIRLGETWATAAGTSPYGTPDYGESVLLEAQRLTHGARNKDYGPPIDDYSRTAEMASGLLRDKLTKPITASEMAMIMVLVKLSRQINAPKRDNMVDAAGYAWVAHSCAEAEKTKEPTSAER